MNHAFHSTLTHVLYTSVLLVTIFNHFYLSYFVWLFSFYILAHFRFVIARGNIAYVWFLYGDRNSSMNHGMRMSSKLNLVVGFRISEPFRCSHFTKNRNHAMWSLNLRVPAGLFTLANDKSIDDLELLLWAALLKAHGLALKFTSPYLRCIDDLTHGQQFSYMDFHRQLTGSLRTLSCTRSASVDTIARPAPTLKFETPLLQLRARRFIKEMGIRAL